MYFGVRAGRSSVERWTLSPSLDGVVGQISADGRICWLGVSFERKQQNLSNWCCPKADVSSSQHNGEQINVNVVPVSPLLICICQRDTRKADCRQAGKQTFSSQNHIDPSRSDIVNFDWLLMSYDFGWIHKRDYKTQEGQCNLNQQFVDSTLPCWQKTFAIDSGVFL